LEKGKPRKNETKGKKTAPLKPWFWGKTRGVVGKGEHDHLMVTAQIGPPKEEGR